jgi:hypothetical protein
MKLILYFEESAAVTRVDRKMIRWAVFPCLIEVKLNSTQDTLRAGAMVEKKRNEEIGKEREWTVYNRIV